VTDSPDAARPAPGDRARLWRAGLTVQLILLAAQFVLGMTVNLYVRIPAVHPGSVRPGSDYFSGLARAVPWALASGPLPLRLHVMLGLVTLAVAIVVVVAALWAGGRGRAVAAWTGLAFVIGAGFNGGSFLIFGSGDSLASLLMACLFLLAVLVYTVALLQDVRGGGPAADGLTAGRQSDADSSVSVPEAPAEAGTDREPHAGGSSRPPSSPVGERRSRKALPPGGGSAA
jgi:hypothetical protein